MKNSMQWIVMAIVLGMSLIVCPLLYYYVGPALTDLQLHTLKVLGWICGASAVYCFIVGEVTNNNSQMDKLWSILPAIYTWYMAIAGDFNIRLVVMACLATVWGVRLTINFGRKGAYHWRFWDGEEDYRWGYIRAQKEFQPRWKWTLFNLLFISTYQNVLVLMTTFPALVVIQNTRPFGWWDGAAAALMLFFIGYETIADEQQWTFQTSKYKMLKKGIKLDELPSPYYLGFNTIGLWSVSRHPNYFAEQSLWFCFYLFSVAAGVGFFNWSIAGALLLIVLFQGSSSLVEEISAHKYLDYKRYMYSVNRFIPGRNFKVNH